MLIQLFFAIKLFISTLENGTKSANFVLENGTKYVNIYWKTGQNM